MYFRTALPSEKAGLLKKLQKTHKENMHNVLHSPENDKLPISQLICVFFYPGNKNYNKDYSTY